MIKKIFVYYLPFILGASLLSNFFKIFFPTSDYIIGVVLGLLCFALSAYLFYFHNEDSKKMNILFVVFFAVSIILIAIELFSLSYPELVPLPSYNDPHYEPNQGFLKMPHSLKVNIYYFDIISRVVYIFNSAAFTLYFSLKLAKIIPHKSQSS